MKNCAICLQEIKQKVNCWQCSATFCTSCIRKWCDKNNSCPVCRVKIKTPCYMCLYKNKRSYRCKPRWVFTMGDEIYFILPVLDDNKLRGHIYSKTVQDASTKNFNIKNTICRHDISKKAEGTIILKLRGKHSIVDIVEKHMKTRHTHYTRIKNNIILDAQEFIQYLRKRGRFF